MEARDILLGPLYIILTYVYIYSVRHKLTHPIERKWFIYAFHSKVLGMLAFSLIYQFYYGGGDTYTYFGFAKFISNLFFTEPVKGIKALFLGHADYSTSVYQYVAGIQYFHRGPQEWAMVKIIAWLAIPCANSYLAVASIFNLVSFLGLWRLYKTLMALYPHCHRLLLFGVFFAPSALFWGSSVMKDTIGIACVGYLFGSVMRMVLLKKFPPKEILIILLCVQLLLLVRSYLLLISLGTLALWIFFRFNKAIKSTFLRVVLFPMLLLIGGGVGSVAVLLLAQQTRDFSSSEAITRKLEGFHTDHGSRGDASVYTLGEVEYTPIGLLSKLPEALLVTLFRPFPWEVKNAVMAVASLESIMYAFLTLIVLIRVNPIRMLRLSSSSPEILMSLVFVIGLGFIVGLSSYNYGVLVRFKIPLLPFYGAILAILYGSAGRKE